MKIIDKRRFILSVVTLSLLITVIAGIVLTVRADQDYQLQTIYVAEGDTLWSIASKYNHNTDIRNFIAEICEINNITPDIKPNQAIQIPILQ